MNITSESPKQEFALEELQALFTLVKALHAASGREEMVSSFLEKLHDVVPYDCSAIILADANSGVSEITHAAGEHAASLIGRKIVPGEGVSGWVLANRHPFCNTDPRLDLPPTLVERFADYRTLAVFPILKGSDLFGAIALYSSSLAKYDTTQQRLLSEASGLLALALSGLSEGMPMERTSDKEHTDSIIPQSATMRIAPRYSTQDLRVNEPVN